MKLALVIALTIVMISTGFTQEENPATFEEAIAQSIAQDKPIIMEFFRDDCLYCELAHAEADTNTAIINSLLAVVHFPIDVLEDEGKILSEKYKVGIYYPVFILTNADGDVFGRWTGYTTSKRFIKSLTEVLDAKVTIQQRLARMETEPESENVKFLANYYSETREYLKAVELWRQIHEMKKASGADYSYEILKSSANAAWNDMMTFDEVLAQADTVLTRMPENKYVIARTGFLMSNLARKKDQTHRIEKYLRAGQKASDGNMQKKMQNYQNTFLCDIALYVDCDTANAVRIKKAGMDPDWETKPDKYYTFAKFWLERKVNLIEAEKYARKAAGLASEGAFKGKVLSTLSGIYYAQGKTREAILILEKAIEQDPSAEHYVQRLEEYNKEI